MSVQGGARGGARRDEEVRDRGAEIRRQSEATATGELRQLEEGESFPRMLVRPQRCQKMAALEASEQIGITTHMGSTTLSKVE